MRVTRHRDAISLLISLLIAVKCSVVLLRELKLWCRPAARGVSACAPLSNINRSTIIVIIIIIVSGDFINGDEI